MSLRLSIVIPFYNVEKYIAECLDSVYNQDIPEEEYEVICVNDASPDGSRDIVLKYQKQHPNLILVEHEVNKKLGAARNTGRRIARGKYLWNVDSDDRIAPNCLGVILDKCEKNDLDVLLFGYSSLNDGQIIKKACPWVEKAPCSGPSFWEEQVIPHQSEISQVWTQVYRRGYLDEQGIYSPEINMSEDEPYTYSSILHAGRIMAVAESFYFARQHGSSLTFLFANHPDPVILYEGSFSSGKNLYAVLSSLPSANSNVKNSLLGVIRYVLTSSRESYERLSLKDRKLFLSKCRRHFFKNTYVFKVLSRKQSLRYISFLITG